ncbi:L,D-transpeptidase family protein [Clostridium sp. 19966]|nr:L,D-transpeptidase family protein [Clostridium sp. 19966]
MILIMLFIIFKFPFYNLRISSAASKNNSLSILVDLNDERLYLIDKSSNQILKRYSIASGKSSTPSPVGSWKVVSMGKWGEGFGTRWIGINVPWGKYGIHGTNRPNSIGSEASHGCIRMFNKDIEELYKYVTNGMPVAIYAGTNGPFEKGMRILTPGYRGADVYEVQRRMKDQGYYPYTIDGIYGEGMKHYVIKFRNDNNLPLSHDIDFDFYKKLGISLVD